MSPLQSNPSMGTRMGGRTPKPRRNTIEPFHKSTLQLHIDISPYVFMCLQTLRPSFDTQSAWQKNFASWAKR